MRFAIPVLAGLGLALVASGLPPLHLKRLTDRVAPYLNGLDGRPSALLPGAADAGKRDRVQDALARLWPLDMTVTRERLLSAGREQSPEAFRVDQLCGAATGVCGGLAVGFMGLLGRATDPFSALAPAVLGAAIGWVAIDRRLSAEVARRREMIRQELPVALDLLTLSIMAGEAVPAAIARVGRMVGGEVGRGFAHVVASVRTGAPVADALRELPARLPEPGAARLIDALCTGMERGAPLAETLRAQADDLRQATRRDLLESGARREILMLLPVVFLIMPTIVAFTLFPGLVSLDLLVP